MQVKAIRRQRNYTAIFFILSLFPAVWFVIMKKTEAAIVIGAAGLVFLILLICKIRLLKDATLIWDNRIIVVPSTLISATDSTEENHAEETVVSTFVILVGTKIYRWGLNGVQGVRLSKIEIDNHRMILSVGDGARSRRIEILHGITDPEEILEVKRKFWHETGVSASLNGW